MFFNPFKYFEHRWYQVPRRFQQDTKYKFLKYFHERALNTFQAFTEYGGNVNPPQTAVCLEIGSGKYFIVPIGLRLLGMQKVITVDKTRFVNPENVGFVVTRFRKYARNLGLPKPKPIQQHLTNQNLDSFLRSFAIDYRAPVDTCHLDLPDGGIDYAVSTIVLDYIERSVLPMVVSEIFRVLRPGGVFYVKVAYAPGKRCQVNGYEVLQYSNEAWANLYHEYGLPNRLYTRDYREIFAAAGFEICQIEPSLPNEADKIAFAQIKIADCFKDYSQDELMEKGATFVLRKPVGADKK